MKTGSGSDPFDEDIESDEVEEGPDNPVELPEDDESTGTSDEESDDTDDEEVPDIPWIFTRENVKSGRDMVQFYLRKGVQGQEDEFVETLEQKLDTSVPVTDAREAAYLVAMNNPDSVAKELKEWGFHLKE